MDLLTLYGVVAVSAMVFCYSLEERDSRFVLGFSISCVLASIYGFLIGSWPFGFLELIWAGIAFRKWLAERAAKIKLTQGPRVS